MNPAIALAVGSVAMTVLRFHLPFVPRPEGATIRTFRVPVPIRVRLQRANVYAVAAVMLLGGVGGWLPFPAQILMASAVMGGLLIPLRYTVTEGGIALGRTRPRAWSEFDAIETGPRRTVLRSAEAGDFTIWLPGSAEDPVINADLRRLVGAAGGEPVAVAAAGRAMAGRKGARRRAASVRTVR